MGLKNFTQAASGCSEPIEPTVRTHKSTEPTHSYLP